MDCSWLCSLSLAARDRALGQRYGCSLKSQMSYKRRFRTFRTKAQDEASVMRDVAFVVYPGYSVMALAFVPAFEVANMLAGDPPYDLRLVSETGGKVKTSAGMLIETEPFTEMPFDTLVVGGATIPMPSTPGLIAFVKDAPKRHRRIAAVCTGAFVLAEAGLLNGRHATTHWMHARDMQRQFPDVKIDEDRIFINDGPIWTSAGTTAGIDLGLALIENDLGPEISKAVARKLAIYHRPGGRDVRS